jgi:hypothetical protein
MILGGGLMLAVFDTAGWAPARVDPLWQASAGCRVPPSGGEQQLPQGAAYPSNNRGLALLLAGGTVLFYVFVEGHLIMAETQISAHVSDATKELVERYVEAHGVKKGHLIEEALLHHLLALRELPADVIIPPRLVVSQGTFDRVARLVDRPRKPTKAMRELMAGKKAR